MFRPTHILLPRRKSPVLLHTDEGYAEQILHEYYVLDFPLFTQEDWVKGASWRDCNPTYRWNEEDGLRKDGEHIPRDLYTLYNLYDDDGPALMPLLERFPELAEIESADLSELWVRDPKPSLKKDQSLNLRLTEKEMDWLQAVADAEDRSPSDMVRRLINNYEPSLDWETPQSIKDFHRKWTD